MFTSKCHLSLDDMPLWQLNLSVISFVAIIASVVAITAAVQRHYRCPRREAIPSASRALLGPVRFGIQRGIALNPLVCANCGAKLR